MSRFHGYATHAASVGVVHDHDALDVISPAAESLASRFDDNLMAIYSWDVME